jgi:hypothetical protein
MAFKFLDRCYFDAIEVQSWHNHKIFIVIKLDIGRSSEQRGLQGNREVKQHIFLEDSFAIYDVTLLISLHKQINDKRRNSTVC